MPSAGEENSTQEIETEPPVERSEDSPSGTSLKDILLFRNGSAPVDKIFKFWLLVTITFGSFLFWTLLFTYLGNVEWVGDKKDFPGFTNDLPQTQSGVSGYCIDIWFAFLIAASLDASFIVLDFNRALIHQWHYFVGMTMAALGSLIALAVYWIGNLHSPEVFNILWVVLVCTALYAGVVMLLEKVHTLMPPRGRSKTHGSLESFSVNVFQFDLPWKRTISYAALSGSVGWVLLKVVPVSLYILNPIIQVTCEITFLSLMGTKQTARYMVFATPFIQGAICVEWGLRQIAQTGSRLSMHPLAFIFLVLLGRVLLDLHLATLFSSRDDLHWARQNVIPSTSQVVSGLGVMWLVEILIGIPLISYIKPLAVVGLHGSACLVFLLCASYGIAFDKIKNICLGIKKE